jgi:hypothetical protein
MPPPELIVSCPECGWKNRLDPAQKTVAPRCGHCHHPLDPHAKTGLAIFRKLRPALSRLNQRLHNFILSAFYIVLALVLLLFVVGLLGLLVYMLIVEPIWTIVIITLLYGIPLLVGLLTDFETARDTFYLISGFLIAIRVLRQCLGN